MKDTLKLWDAFVKREHEVYLSQITISEIEKCAEPKRAILYDYLSEVEYTQIEITEEILSLAQKRVDMGILKPKSFDDCQYIATAVVDERNLRRTGMSVLVDIGGSGIKIAEYSNGNIGTIMNHGKIGTYEDFVEALHSQNGNGRIKGVAISAAGFINTEEGRVIQCKCAPFMEGEIVRKLNKEFPLAKIQIVNDGEAHARALLLPKNNVRFGAIHLALGTSVSFGVINEKREIIRTCNGENWDIGDYQLRTREAPYDLWYKLGTDGLSELENNDMLGGDPYQHFGMRLGDLLRNLAVIFRPRTIGLSGGIIVSHGDEILEGVRQEWRREGFSTPVNSGGIEFKVLKSETTVMEGLTTLL